MRLVTERLVLRPLTLADAPHVKRLVGVREVAGATADIPFPFEDGMAEGWIASINPAAQSTFGITCDGELVGAIGLHLDAANRQAELGYWLGLDHHGRGYATEAGAAVIRHGFDTLGLDRIFACHLGRNPGSGRVLEKLGFRREGTLRSHVLRFGVREDQVYWGLLRTDSTAR